ncbi:probable disease resistance protein At5g66900 [Neltuma alba]|uniref:probable disease resistance protein At5g66900 n=1 Tax=Neltuma alba TaxID=207710 RepID=UPI0010A463C9|nr:probable disease resistance protein At5g66900 [Prosopis alba]XP_028779388.1 probable disease resistance protein At5g66900 [Prosopis alba]
MQHDLLRDLAVHLSSEKPLEQRENLIIDLNKNNNPELWSEPKKGGVISGISQQLSIMLKQKQVAARSVSISSGEAFTSKWWSMKPYRAEALVLNIGGNDYTLPGFIRYMRKLKVLILINYSFHPSQLHGFELLGSLSNLKRIRLQRVSVPSLCKFKNLRKLSLYMCSTSQAFRSDASIRDALPNLVDMSIDYCKDFKTLPVGFCDITCLEKLSITNCHSFCGLPHDIGKLGKLQVLRLNNCTDLVDIPDSIKMLQELSLLDMSYCISLRRLPADIGGLSNLSKLYMMGCSRLSELPASVTLLKKLRKVICDEEIAISWGEHFDPSALAPSIETTRNDNHFNLNWLFGQLRNLN